MSSPEPYRVSRLAAAAALALGLAACFRPLYGPTASGVPLQGELAAIAVDGKMIDTPIYLRARRLLSWAEAHARHGA